MTEKQYLTALYSFLPFGPARTKLLLEYFGSAKKAWNADRKELLEINLSPKITEKFVKIITNVPLHLDVIVRKSGMKTSEVTSKLTMMEIKELVKNLGNGNYRSN